MAETLPLTSIRTDGNTQARIELSATVIGEYAEALERGDTFPPVEVYFDGETYWLADGFHRIKAAAQVGQETIEVVVHEGGQREALLHAVGANTAHGLQRSNADKRKAALMLLQDEEWRQWSDRQIARHCAVSDRFVNTLRHELSANRSQIETRKVQRGKSTYTMGTGRIGTTQAKRPANVITMPTGRMRETPETRAGAQPIAIPSAVVSQPEVIAPPVSPPVGAPTTVTPPTIERGELESVPPALTLVIAWEQASEEGRQEFVREYRAVLQELLAVKEEQPAALPPDVHPDTQPGLILIVLRTATTPLSQEELAQAPGINRRALGRNLTRLCKTGQIEKTANGRYVLRAASQ